MINSYPASEAPSFVQVLRHAEVKKRLKVSSAKLFDMVAKGQFAKPFKIVPGGRAVGWLESDVDEWVLDRKANLTQEGA